MEREYVAEYLLKMAGTMPCRTHKAYYDTLKTPWEQYIKRNLKQIFLGGEKRKEDREGEEAQCLFLYIIFEKNEARKPFSS